MEGNDRVRFCAECKKNVYNLSALTRRDAEALLRRTNGDLCTQLYRRADGTVLTADCPVALKVKVARVRRRLTWAMTGALGLSTAFAQQSDAVLAGVVKDQTGAVIARAYITVINERTGETMNLQGDESGKFRTRALSPDYYTVSASSPGFSTTTKKDVQAKGEVDLPFELLVGTAGGPMVVATKPWWRRLL
jgi:hypothetical protein